MFPPYKSTKTIILGWFSIFPTEQLWTMTLCRQKMSANANRNQMILITVLAIRISVKPFLLDLRAVSLKLEDPVTTTIFEHYLEQFDPTPLNFQLVSN